MFRGTGDLDFEVMVTRAEGADLLVSAFHRTVAHTGSVGVGHTAVLLGDFQVVSSAVTISHAPFRAAFDSVPELVTGELHESGAAHTRGDALE